MQYGCAATNAGWRIQFSLSIKAQLYFISFPKFAVQWLIYLPNTANISPIKNYNFSLFPISLYFYCMFYIEQFPKVCSALQSLTGKYRTFYSATSILKKCRKVVLGKWFFKLGFCFWSTTFLEPEKKIRVWRTTFLEPLFYTFPEMR